MNRRPDPDVTWVGLDKSNTDLRYQDLSEKILFQTDLRGSRLYGAKVALECRQFDGVKLDEEQVAALLFMLSQADIEPAWQKGLEALIYEVAGPELYRSLQRFLKLA